MQLQKVSLDNVCQMVMAWQNLGTVLLLQGLELKTLQYMILDMFKNIYDNYILCFS